MSSRFERLPARIIVAVVAIPLIVLAAFEGGYVFFAFIAIVSSLSLVEFYRMMQHKQAVPLVGLGVTAGLLVNLAFVYERFQVDLYGFFAERGVHLRLFSQLQFLLVLIVIFIFLTLCVELFRTKGSALMNVGATLSGVLVISLGFGLLLGLRELYSYGFPVHRFIGDSFFAGEDELQIIRAWGGWTVLTVLVALWTCDTAAYFVGSTMGKSRLFERVSPGKTWEGAVAGFVAAVAVTIASRQFLLPYLSFADGVILGVLIGLFGQVGDLVESRFKRDAGIKDSSALIPGHGGVYDRFDSLVFVSPIVYLYIDFIVLS